MKWIPSLRTGAIAVVAALATVGCIKSDQKTVLEKDGSGTLDVTVVIDMAKIKELTEMMKGMMPPEKPAGDAAMGDEKKDDISKEFSKEEVEKQLKKTEGNELKEYSNETANGKTTVHMLIAYKSFENLVKTSILGNDAVVLAKNEDGSYTLTLDAKGGQGGGDASAGGPGAGGGMDTSAMAPMLEPFLGGLELKTELTLPGTIVETNGTKSEDGTKVSWALDFKTLTSADKTKKDASMMKATFKGEGVDLKPFSFKPDAEAAGKMFK